MLESVLQGPHAGQQAASLVLVLFAAVYAVYALFGRPHEALRPVLDGIPLAALIGVYTYAFDLNQHGGYSRLLSVIVGQPAGAYTLMLLGAAMGFVQPFLADYARVRATRRWRFEHFESDENAKESAAAVVVSTLIRMAGAVVVVALGLLVALDHDDLLRGRHVSLSTAILAGAVIAFLQHLPQLARTARTGSGKPIGFLSGALIMVVAALAGILTFAVALALFIFAASHLGWSVVVYLLLFGVITGVYTLVQRGVTHLPRPALVALVVVLLLVAGGLQLAARA